MSEEEELANDDLMSDDGIEEKLVDARRSDL